MTRDEAEALARLTGEPVKVWPLDPLSGDVPNCVRCYTRRLASHVAPTGSPLCMEHARSWMDWEAFKEARK